MRGDESMDSSPVPIGDRADMTWREDAATRHRIARAQREAQANPSPEALPEPPQAGPEPASAAEPWSSPDEAVRYPQATPPEASGFRPRDEAIPFDAYSSQPAYEPRYAGDTQWPDRDHDDGQEWKPLIDPVQVVRGITRSKLLIVSTTILGTVLGIAIAVSTPKKYEATTEIVINPGDLNLSNTDLTQQVGQPDAALAVVETRIKMVTSGNVLDKVVADLKLADNPEFNGQGSGGLSVMSLVRSILSRQDGPADEDKVRQALAVRNLAENLSVDRSGKSFVVSISAKAQSPTLAADIANTTRDVFQDQAAKDQFDTAGRATKQLTAKLEDLRNDVETAERKVEDFRATHDLVDAQGHLISDDQMLKLNEQLSLARAHTLQLNARAASARSLDVNSAINGTLPEEINSNTMSELRAQYATLKQDADRASVKLGPRHPEYQALNAQLAGARERIAGELRRIASSLQVDLKRAVQLEQDLASRLAQAKVQSGDVNSNLVSLRELERDATAKRSVYEQYLLRAKETGQQENINTTNISKWTEARPPLEAAGPSRAVISLAGLLLGLASGIGLGAMRGALASLRERADSRSRLKTNERRLPVEDEAYRAAPPAKPAQAQGPGLFSRLLSAMRKPKPADGALPQQPAGTAGIQPAGPAASERAAPMQPAASHQPAPRNDAPQPLPYGQQAGYPPLQPGQFPAGPQSVSNDQQAQIDDIRSSLREFREKVRELTESRSRRRYF